MNVQQFKDNPNWVELRKYLHRNPEVSEHEKNTAAFVYDLLMVWGVKNIQRNLGGHGILAILDGDQSGPNIMFRAELDALPIPEENDIDHISQSQGVSHACGHDGHMTILLKALFDLIQLGIPKGKVAFLFQPAEENGVGARAILEDQAFDFQPDYVFALHNLPGFPLHQVVTRKGSFTPAVKSLILHMKGKTSHAAEPEKGINPAYYMSQVMHIAEKLEHRPREADDFCLVTPVYVNVGTENYGISAGDGSMHFTLRAWRQEKLDEVSQTFKTRVEEALLNSGLSLTWSTLQEFDANKNDHYAVDLVEHSAQKLDLDIYQIAHPMSWGEDFGSFTQKFDGAMFGLGAGEETPALHNPDYDFPDEITETGAHMFLETAKCIWDS